MRMWNEQLLRKRLLHDSRFCRPPNAPSVRSAPHQDRLNSVEADLSSFLAVMKHARRYHQHNGGRALSQLGLLRWPPRCRCVPLIVRFLLSLFVAGPDAVRRLLFSGRHKIFRLIGKRPPWTGDALRHE